MVIGIVKPLPVKRGGSPVPKGYHLTPNGPERNVPRPGKRRRKKLLPTRRKRGLL